MIEGLLAVAAGCVVDTLATHLEHSNGQYLAHHRVAVVNHGGCERIDVWLPADTTFSNGKTRLRLGDDTKKRVGADRWSTNPPDEAGVRRAVLLLPELVTGDRALLDFTLSQPDSLPWQWRPGADAVGFAELRVTSDLPLDTWGDLTADRKGVWVSEPGRETVVQAGAVMPPPAVTTTTATRLSALEALERAAELSWLPPGVDGPLPVAGQQALVRGAADDRGYARTIIALAAGGSDNVELGRWLDREGGPPQTGAAEVAIWWHDGMATPLVHPDSPARRGVVASRSGAVAHTHPGPAAPPDVPDVLTVRTTTLHIPTGDPMATLFPGGGSSYSVEEVLTFEHHGRARTWSVPLPAGALDLTVHCDDVSVPYTWRRRPDDLVLVVPPGRRQIALRVSYRLPDAPVYGAFQARDGERLSAEVRSDDGLVRVRDSWWWLESAHGQPVQPSRDAIVDAIGWRYNTRSMPEPALPTRLKRQDASWELAEKFRPALGERAIVAPLPEDPAWPRPLLKARRSGAVTSIEGALILRLYAGQVRMPAMWVLARPAELGPGHPVAPVGYSEGLTVLSWEGEERWIDPACRVCAPFEIRPHLEGASAWSQLYDRTPDPTEGLVTVETSAPVTTWTLSGPPGLLLRLWLEQVPEDQRSAALALRLGGPGAVVTVAEGLAVGGADITLSVHGGTTLGHSWTQIPETADGAAWWSWIGVRTVPDPGPAAQLDTEWFHFERADGVATLLVKRRAWPPEAVSALRAARGH